MEKQPVFFARISQKTLEKIRLQKAQLRIKTNEEWVLYSINKNK